MPLYDLQNKKTGEVKEIFCRYEEKEEALKDQHRYVMRMKKGLVHEVEVERQLEASRENEELDFERKEIGRERTVLFEMCSDITL